MADPTRLATGIRDSRFGDGCVVADAVNIYEAVFGDRCFVGPYVEVQNDVVCGDNVRIQSHTLICEGMRIGDDVFVGHGVMTANSRYPRAGAGEWQCEPPRIGNRVAIGSNATILPGITIADDAVIGAGAIVSKDVPAGAVVIGRDEILTRRDVVPDGGTR
ncbi:acyltransferase [Microbacterium caowuchunii]|uniref:N-acetyltransferase n=1 Tax=Microbacterium caowuchunii TaxID=2614638 RepID=A0A5N0TQ67_9MICO|nr:acyltransferase [Microbacterium caowuchunii]KAA9135539.1 N-acetyltransferase [Microbacterium caowuchunii]